MELEDRRVDDNSIREQIKNIAENISLLRGDIAEMKPKLDKIAVLEERGLTHNSSIMRAFEDIQMLQAWKEGHTRDMLDKFSNYDQKLAFVAGVSVAVSVLWTVFGVAMFNSFRENMAAIQDHVAEDRLFQKLHTQGQIPQIPQIPQR